MTSKSPNKLLEGLWNAVESAQGCEIILAEKFTAQIAH